MSDFVLVHGALFGAWCWEAVADRLRAGGHRVVVPDLPGSGDDRKPLREVEFADYVRRVVEASTGTAAPVLVGHSFGGLCVTAAAQHLDESRIVYVAAFAPTRSCPSIADLLALPEGSREGLRSSLVVAGEPPIASIGAAAARQVLYQDATTEQARRFSSRLGRHPTWLTTADYGDRGRTVPSAYISCRRDRAIPLAFQHAMAQKRHALVTVELDTDHCPFLTAPAVLADTLDQLDSWYALNAWRGQASGIGPA